MAEMRRVQKTGGSTLIISLPKKWTQANSISNGDVLSLIPGERDTLIIDPHFSEKEKGRIKKLTTNGESPEHFFRRLIGVYINGFDDVVISAGSTMNPETRSSIRQFTRMVIGPEITEEDINTVILKDLSVSEGFGMKSVVRRIYRICYSMLHDALMALREGNVVIAKDVVSRDSEVDRLFWLLSKQYNLMLKKPRLQMDEPTVEESLNYYLTGRVMERIADHARNISRHLISVRENRKSYAFTKKVLGHFSRTGDLALGMVEHSFQSFLKGDVALANRTIDRTDELKTHYNEGISEISGTKPDVAVSIAGVMDSMKRAGMYASDIAEIAINNQERN